MRRQAHTEQVGDDDGVVFHQNLSERNPHVAGVAKPVQQQDRRAMTTDPDVLSAAANRHLLAVKSGGPGLDGSMYRCRILYCHRTRQ
jgi:hypothetical protein